MEWQLMKWLTVLLTAHVVADAGEPAEPVYPCADAQLHWSTDAVKPDCVIPKELHRSDRRLRIVQTEDGRTIIE